MVTAYLPVISSFHWSKDIDLSEATHLVTSSCQEYVLVSFESPKTERGYLQN